MHSRRTPPCLTVHIPGKPVHHSRNASLPAFGISSFSHRVARSQGSQESLGPARRNSADSGDGSELEEAAVAMAQVAPRAPSRLLAHPRQKSDASSASHSIPISVDVHPPTPNPSSLPVSAHPSPSTRRRSRSAEADLRAVKQSRRVASIYSISSSSGNGTERDSFYLRPDLSGASSLTLDQLPRTVSLEDLTIRSVAPSGVSTTGAVETLSHSRTSSSSSSLYSTASPSSPVGTVAPSIADSRLALTSHAAPPATTSQPHHQPSSSISSTRTRTAAAARPVSTASTSRFREVLGTGPGGPRETEADRLKRLYLCPWEGTSPKPAAGEVARSRSRRSRVMGVGASLGVTSRDPEKGGWEEKDVEAAQEEEGQKVPSRAEQKRKRLLVNLALVFLAALVFADLIVLNVRVFTGRDAYLSE
ncbi:hypothetical protein JCM6882_009330 [Rhodosporidiobolus microsporus]